MTKNDNNNQMNEKANNQTDDNGNDKLYAIWIEVSETDLHGTNYKRVELDLEPSAFFDRKVSAVKFAKDLHEATRRLAMLEVMESEEG